MAAEEEHRRRLIARLEHALQQPNAFQRLVDRLPDDNAIHGLKVWGAMHGLYPDSGGMGETPGAPPRVTRDGGHDHTEER
jgi:hypothetical protein